MAFFTVLAVAVLAVIGLRLAPLSELLFTEPDRLWVLDILPADEVVAAKARHARHQPRFDIGYFGNSRIVMIGAADTRTSGQTFFNFAVGGQSLRQSVLFLEYLDRYDRVPRRIVISVDHVELGVPPGLDGVSPPAPERWWLRVTEAWLILKTFGVRTAAINAISAATVEAGRIKLSFSTTYIYAKIMALTGAQRATPTYLKDGSRPERYTSTTPDQRPINARRDVYPLLEHDLSSLGRLKAKGVDIILYESPLSPAIAAETESRLSDNARQVRERFREQCGRIGLTCLPSPQFGGPAWIDRDHAPTSLLGPWISDVLNTAGPR